MNIKEKFIKLLSLLFVFIILLTHYKTTPSYNPFDNQFDISIYKLIADDCDTVRSECSYWNFMQKKGRFKTYYQFYGNGTKVVAKGGFYIIDTLITADNGLCLYDEACKDSLLNLPIYIPDLNRELEEFGYELLERGDYEYWVGFVEKRVGIVNKKVQDTIQLEVDIFTLERSRTRVVRCLRYFTSPDVCTMGDITVLNTMKTDLFLTE
ncbi:MAG: hypothetical protein AB8B69_01345 [Chitinophagales bacterium]